MRRERILLNAVRFSVGVAQLALAAAIVICGSAGHDVQRAQAGPSRMSAPSDLQMHPVVATVVIDREPATPPAWATPTAPRTGNAGLAHSGPAPAGVFVIVALFSIVAVSLIRQFITRETVSE